MKLTKYQHACFVAEKEGVSIIVDPGTFSHDFIMPKNVAAIIVTHEHPDHFDEKLIGRILATHPKATVIAHESITGHFTNRSTIAAKVGERYETGPFVLRFFGGAHASIADSIQVPPNLGVLIDDRLYYPGDSFVVPINVPVHELALPASAPWLKISEAMNFLTQVRPEFVFPTHDAILSEEGKTLVDRMLGAVAGGINSHYARLDGSSVELS